MLLGGCSLSSGLNFHWAVCKAALHGWGKALTGHLDTPAAVKCHQQSLHEYGQQGKAALCLLCGVTNTDRSSCFTDNFSLGHSHLNLLSAYICPLQLPLPVQLHHCNKNGTVFKLLTLQSMQDPSDQAVLCQWINGLIAHMQTSKKASKCF